VTTKLVLVAAVARNGVIGRDGDLAWRDAADLKHLRELTWGQPVLMGRKTWDSLPTKFKPLPGRRNLVMTRDAGWSGEGAERVASIDDALQLAGDAPTLFVLGGAEVYYQALPRADELVLTEVDADLDGDVRFPGWSRDEFELVGEQAMQGFRFASYRRKGNTAG
jgi:dihydrofolate reductase